MATLITGAGLVGSQAARLLMARGEPTWLYDAKPNRPAIESVVGSAVTGLIQGDIEDLPKLERVLNEHRIDRILHTAAVMTAGMRENLLGGISANVMGTAAVLEAARRSGARRVVLTASSTAYYGLFNEPAARPYPEDFSMRVVSQRPQSIYAATKLAGEHLGLLYADLYGVDVVIVRFAAVMGLSDCSAGGLVGRLLRAFLDPAIRGKPAVFDDPLIVWRGGDEFVDVRDAASGALAALFAQSAPSRVYSIGPGILSSFDDFARAATEAVPGLRVEMKVQPTGGFAGYRHLRPQPSDNRAAKRELGWTPQYDLTATMRETAAYLSARRADPPRNG